MKKTAFFTATCLLSGLLLSTFASAQTSTTTTPTVETTKPVVKKDNNQAENPDATLDGSSANRTAPAAAPLKQKKSRHVNPADIKPIDMSKVETAQPGEKVEEPTPTGIPFGKNRPVAGQKTVESAPLKKPANLKPLAEEKN